MRKLSEELLGRYAKLQLHIQSTGLLEHAESAVPRWDGRADSGNEGHRLLYNSRRPRAGEAAWHELHLEVDEGDSSR